MSYEKMAKSASQSLGEIFSRASAERKRNKAAATGHRKAKEVFITPDKGEIKK